MTHTDRSGRRWRVQPRDIGGGEGIRYEAQVMRGGEWHIVHSILWSIDAEVVRARILERYP